MKEFKELLDVMHKLRAECPWDKEQSISSLRTYLIEEAYEVLDAMNEYPQSTNNLVEELGDLLLQIVFQAEILSEKSGRPNIQDVISGITDKLIRRHPHVFAKAEVKDATEVLENWEDIKRKEKGGASKSLFEGFKSSGPSLMSAIKIGQKSERVRFDWDTSEEVWTQTHREIEELRSATTQSEKEEELGDVLFCIAQWARHEDLDAEASLQKANHKFLKRFRWMEADCEKSKKSFKDMSREEKEDLWKRAKQNT